MSAPRVDHIGIVVDELEPAIAAMARMLPGALAPALGARTPGSSAESTPRT